GAYGGQRLDQRGLLRLRLRGGGLGRAGSGGCGGLAPGRVVQPVGSTDVEVLLAGAGRGTTSRDRRGLVALARVPSLGLRVARALPLLAVGRRLRRLDSGALHRALHAHVRLALAVLHAVGEALAVAHARAPVHGTAIVTGLARSPAG